MVIFYLLHCPLNPSAFLPPDHYCGYKPFLYLALSLCSLIGVKMGAQRESSMVVDHQAAADGVTIALPLNPKES